MKILAITQARYGSSRLPGKVVKTINGKTLLEIHLERILKSKLVSKIKVATTIEEEAKNIVDIANKLGIEVFRGSVNDVLERFYLTALPENPDYVVRLTSDCPLVDPKEIDKVIQVCVDGKFDYASNTLECTYPDGIDVEICKFSVLKKAYEEAELQSDREHVTPYIWRNSSDKGGTLFSSFCVRSKEDFSAYRITVDNEEDFAVIKHLINQIGIDKDWLDYVKYLDSHPEVKGLNSELTRNEGYQKSIINDKL